MSIQYLEEETRFATTELTKLIQLARDIKLPRKNLIKILPKLSRLEAMVLDSAAKDLDLIKLRTTILVLPEQYIDMLQNVTQHLASAIINSI